MAGLALLDLPVSQTEGNALGLRLVLSLSIYSYTKHAALRDIISNTQRLSRIIAKIILRRSVHFVANS